MAVRRRLRVAGELRTINISTGEQNFVPVDSIPEVMQQFTQGVQERYRLRDISEESWPLNPGTCSTGLLCRDSRTTKRPGKL